MIPRLLLSVDELPAGSRVLVYGCGSAGKSLYALLHRTRPDVRVLGFVDSNRGGRLGGRKIYRLDRFLDRFTAADYETILIASMHAEEIAAGLERAGIANFRIARVPAPVLATVVGASWFTLFADWGLMALNRLLRAACGHRRDRIVFVGEYGGMFSGNAKYLYLEAERRGLQAFWLVRDRAWRRELEQGGVRVVTGGLRAWWVSLRAAWLAVDNRDWQARFPCLLRLPLPRIQLWHGVGFKRIERMLLPAGMREKLSVKERALFRRRYPRYDRLVSTSPFYSREVFAPAFHVPEASIVEAGYPRNDIFYRDIRGAHLFTDRPVLDEVRQRRREGWKVALFMPTFRDIRARFDWGAALPVAELAPFLARHRLLLVMKFHSLPGFRNLCGDGDTCMRVCDNRRDAYPLLKEADLLVTDYSSVYTDFLHAGRPVLFYPFDYEEYVTAHRDIQFDYDEWTPGPKARTFAELLHWLDHFLVQGKDGFADRRRALLGLAFRHHDGESGSRVLAEMLPAAPGS